MARFYEADWTWVVLAVCWCLLSAVDLWRRRGAGAVLLDLAGSLDRWSYLLLGGAIAAKGIIGIFNAHGTIWSAVLVVLGLSTGFIAWGTKRIQLREAGIWRGGSLIPWDKIEGYEISASPAIHVKTRGKSMRYCCDLPPALRSKVEDLLVSKCQALQPKG